MARYKEQEKGQGMFLTVDLARQLVPGTFEWTLNYLIGKEDLQKLSEKILRQHKEMDKSEDKQKKLKRAARMYTIRNTTGDT